MPEFIFDGRSDPSRRQTQLKSLDIRCTCSGYRLLLTGSNAYRDRFVLIFIRNERTNVTGQRTRLSPSPSCPPCRPAWTSWTEAHSQTSTSAIETGSETVTETQIETSASESETGSESDHDCEGVDGRDPMLWSARPPAGSRTANNQQRELTRPCRLSCGAVSHSSRPSSSAGSRSSPSLHHEQARPHLSSSAVSHCAPCLRILHQLASVTGFVSSSATDSSSWAAGT